MWSRVPTLIADKTAPDDWTVLRHGQPVGRVYRSPSPGGGVVWRWFAWGPVGHGEAADMGAALEAVRGAVG